MTIEPNSPVSPTVVIIRGNSASGKSSTAHEVRRRYGRGCSLIEQDYLRRVVLREHGSDATPTVAPAFIMAVAQAALAHGYHLVLEGILHTRQYGEPLRQLIAGHPGPSFVFWLQVSLGETGVRAATSQVVGAYERVLGDDLRRRLLLMATIAAAAGACCATFGVSGMASLLVSAESVR